MTSTNNVPASSAEVSVPTPRSGVIEGLKDFCAGTAGGVALVLTGHPFDTLKVRLQTNPGEYKGIVDCVKKTYSREGFAGFYRGMSAPLFGVSIMNSFLFFNYGLGQRAIRGDHDPMRVLSISEIVIAGAYAGLAVSLVESPADLFKAKMQVQDVRPTTGVPRFKSAFDCARYLTTSHGLRGVYQGLGATVVRNVPANAAYFGLYEYLKRKMTPEGGGTLQPTAVLAAGGVSGIAYWTLSYPFDVVKSRMQTDNIFKNRRQFQSVADCFTKINRELGWRGFWTGFAPCLIRAFPANAACFFAYEITRKLLG